LVSTDSKYWLGVPLRSSHGTFGALVVKSCTGGATHGEHDLELLQFVSAQAAAAIERKRMHARLEHIALYDQLTNLPNRDLLHDRLRTALSRARREHGHLALLYLDLDNFKQVNDNHGHAAGDALLQEVARRLQGCTRESDTVARLGGDEFVVLIEGLRESAHARLIAEKVRRALAAPVLVGGQAVHTPPSVGVAVYPLHGDNEQSLLRHADAAMYRAKRKGGNQVGEGGIVAEPDRHRS
ncbi:MAG: sensor domain-containing diguanylate cyclase, partial [Pseudoxanthomonas sp.]